MSSAGDDRLSVDSVRWIDEVGTPVLRSEAVAGLWSVKSGGELLGFIGLPPEVGCIDALVIAYAGFESVVP